MTQKERIMRNLGCTEAEADEILDMDKEIDRGNRVYFDMTKEEDFVRVGISFNFTNIGMYKINDIQFKIDSIGKHADTFVFKEANVAEVNRFSSDIVTLYFVICTKDLTAQELNEAVNSIKLSSFYVLFSSLSWILFGKKNEYSTSDIKDEIELLENEKVIDEIQQINQRLHALQNNIEHTK